MYPVSISLPGYVEFWESDSVDKEANQMRITETREAKRLIESRQRQGIWKRWGPYLSERAWGTVREDYSADGDAWNYLPHSHSRSKAYRWGEDGIAGISDRHQILCFSIALWNGRDPILKERLFGLSGPQGNHGEDVKERYHYLDATPTHSYLSYLYHYPQGEFPYQSLVDINSKLNRTEPEFDLEDTGIFDEGRYFDVTIEYAKAAAEDILIRITIHNNSTGQATLDVLPTLWYRNTWSWGADDRKPRLRAEQGNIIKARHFDEGTYYLVCGDQPSAPSLLFTDNETNTERLYGSPNSGYTKDGINDFVVGGRAEAINPDQTGTKASARYQLNLSGGESVRLYLRLTNDPNALSVSGQEFDASIDSRLQEADEFYGVLCPADSTVEMRRIQRQAMAGMIWSKQFYYYDVRRWLRGDPGTPEPPRSRLHGRNKDWRNINNADIISMPDKWEYPWFAAWDLAFHCVPLALIDPDFAKAQLTMVLREWYMHPNGQIPAYEWNFGDVNPPVHAWAALKVYELEKEVWGNGDLDFLERVFHKLLLNFTWWVNRKDTEGNNIFQGGFLGLDNIGVFDRSATLPSGGSLEQSDATSWMGMYCLNLMTMALELARRNPVYEDVASKFFEHFVYIARAMNNMAGKGLALWDEGDGFYYDVLHLPGQRPMPLKVRSMVGLIPLFAVTTLDETTVNAFPGFRRRMQYFIDNFPELSTYIEIESASSGIRRFLSLVNRDRLARILGYMLDESEFLSAYGIRSLSRYHLDNPYRLDLGGSSYTVNYEPAESQTPLFGGNSNWRGPIWMPVNFLLIDSLKAFHSYLGDDFKLEFPRRSGEELTLSEVADRLAERLISLFRVKETGLPAIFDGKNSELLKKRSWGENLLFYEYFNGETGEGLGASHQTGWTGLVAELIRRGACGE